MTDEQTIKHAKIQWVEAKKTYIEDSIFFDAMQLVKGIGKYTQ